MAEKMEMDSLENRLIKELCANSLRKILRQLRTATVQELSRISGFEMDTAESVISRLCFAGEFTAESVTGETDTFYRFNGEYKLILAICVLEKNRVVAAVSDLYGEYLEKDEISACPDRVEFFDGIVESYREKYPAIGLLAFGMAGFEEKAGGRLLSVNFPQLEVHFREHFMEKYRLPSILENDIKAAVMGYYETRNVGEEKCAGALYLPRTHHPAAAICMDGKIYRGRDNAAGEVIYLDTAVQWKHFGSNELDYGAIDVPKLIVDMTLPMVVFLNPDCLVIYGPGLPADTGEELQRRLMGIMPREFIPNIVFVPDILPDFLDGLVHLALDVLKPKVDFAETAD